MRSHLFLIRLPVERVGSFFRRQKKCTTFLVLFLCFGIRNFRWKNTDTFSYKNYAGRINEQSLHHKSSVCIFQRSYTLVGFICVFGCVWLLYCFLFFQINYVILCDLFNVCLDYCNIIYAIKPFSCFFVRLFVLVAIYRWCCSCVLFL